MTPGTILGITALILPSYLAFCLTGFGVMTGDAQGLPIYIYFALLLLALQYVISKRRGLWHTISLIATCSVPLAYVAFYVFIGYTGTGWLKYLTDPKALVAQEGIVIAVFVLDAVNRRRVAAGDSVDGAAGAGGTGGAAAGMPERSWLRRAVTFGGAVALAGDLIGFALLMGMLAGVLRILSDPHTYLTSHIQALLKIPPLAQLYALLFPGVPVERIDFPALDQPTPIGDPPTLWSVNSTIFLAALFLATVAFFVIIALVVVKNNGAVLTSLNDLGRVVGSAFGQVGISVRRVLMGIVWVVPALLIALFATALTGQLNANQTGASSTLDLFLPSASGVPDVFLNIVIGAVAIVFVILAVSIAEANLAILRDTLRILRNTGQIVWIASPVVIYGLAALNAAIIFGFGRNVGTPFKAGGTGAVSLGFLILLPLGAYLYQRFVRPNAASSGGGASTSAPVPVGARTSRGGQP